ncbi:MAG: penicillin-binding protein 1C, partial [Planctomycetes bacterium]|nr:penicillin-binding protein 1C [Planctomycetota bacterium]
MNPTLHRTAARVFRRLFFRLLCAAIMAVLAMAVLWHAFPFPREHLAAAANGGSAFLLDRRGGVVAWRVDAGENWRIPAALDGMSASIINATVAAEDERFWRHAGVDPVAVARAAAQNALAGRTVSGASTVTMQTVRMLHPRERTFRTKCIEAFRALQLESTSSKSAVLELYLNLAPYGGNVVGVEAAALRYFGKHASGLTLAEAALLAGIPQSPARYNPARRLDAALERREYVFRRMLELGLASPEEIALARRETITLQDRRTPASAPRFADFVLQRRGAEGGVIRTTLDPDVQAVVAEASARRARELNGMGIQGLAVVVIDVRSSDVLAMLGSADPNDAAHGFVNCAAVRRQPGSLLKPFIFAAAFSSGELTPASIVYDVPMSWHGYSPQNMDSCYLGPMTAEQALSASRNVPAVDLLDRIGTARLSGDAARLGLGIFGGEERCGLSLALGTAEVRLVDIANAYAALARLGTFLPLRTAADEPACAGERVFPRGAAYLALRCLGAPPPGTAGSVAWKTGTSWNCRDAWAVAVTPEYVAGVWCGNHSGNGHPVLVGARSALPLAMEVAERVSGGTPAAWERPPGVRTRIVCALSGQPASPACPHRVEAEYLPGISSETPCRLHRFAQAGGTREATVAWPPAAAAFMAERRGTPGSVGTAAPAIEISSPGPGARYALPVSAGAEKHLVFTCRSGCASTTVYWFVDGELFAVEPACEPVKWLMSPGAH